MRKLLSFVLTAGLSVAVLGIFSGMASAQFPRRNFAAGYSLGYGPFGPRYANVYSIQTGLGGYRLANGYSYNPGVYGGVYAGGPAYHGLNTATTWYGGQAVSSNYVTGYGSVGPRLGSSYSAAVTPFGSQVQTARAYTPGIFGPGPYYYGTGTATGVGFVGNTAVPVTKWYEYNLTPFGSYALTGTWPW